MSKMKDITGQRFGRLAVISRAENKGTKAAWNCRCDCGGQSIVTGDRLRSGRAKSCGCRKRQPKDISDMVFGYLTAVKLRPLIGTERIWECSCVCGSSVNIHYGNLTSGRIKSCGCKHNELVRKARTKHGLSNKRYEKGHELYSVWVSMRSRCNSPNAQAYKYYGGKGVKVCKRWDSFPAFIKDMGERPRGYSIDRIDPTGNYEPENCRWADDFTQANNKRAK